MTSPFLKDKFEDVPDINLDDLDDILNELTAAEIEELNGDFDPDNSLLPPSQRCRDQTEKSPTGPFNKKKLNDFLEKQAKEEKDWEQNKAYVKETRGKVYKPKAEPKREVKEGEEDIETEWDEVLRQASEEELVDLAAVLGFHGMLNQTQYYASWEGRKVEAGGFHGVARPQELKILPDEAPNATDIEDSIAKLKSNDAKLKHLNLNNIKNVSIERLIEVCESLKDNTELKKLEMASVAANDKVAKVLADSLKSNKTLRTLNIESNFISAEAILDIMKAINENKGILEFRVANQKPEVLGNKVEMELAKLVEANNTLLRFGIIFEFPAARIRVHEKLQANYDHLRKKRRDDTKS